MLVKKEIYECSWGSGRLLKLEVTGDINIVVKTQWQLKLSFRYCLREEARNNTLYKSNAQQQKAIVKQQQRAQKRQQAIIQEK
jgi:hypothetical protein